MIKAFIRCNEGHYFDKEYCPFDGWSSEESKQFSKILEKILSQKGKISFEEFRHQGISNSTIARMLVIDFGEGNFIFEAISPDGYFINGKFLPLPDMTRDLL